MGGDFKRADEVEVNVYPLTAAVPAPLALMDNHFLDKLVEHVLQHLFHGLLILPYLIDLFLIFLYLILLLSGI